MYRVVSICGVQRVNRLSFSEMLPNFMHCHLRAAFTQTKLMLPLASQAGALFQGDTCREFQNHFGHRNGTHPPFPLRYRDEPNRRHRGLRSGRSLVSKDLVYGFSHTVEEDTMFLPLLFFERLSL